MKLTLLFFLFFFCYNNNLLAQSCQPIYVSTTGTSTNTGTKTAPTSLQEGLNRAQTTGATIKMAIGIYNLDSTLLIPSNITLEGGFDPNNNWAKTSLAGATTLFRTNANPEGIANTNQSITAIEIANSENFRLQDLTISTADANIDGLSTYGIHMNNASNYYITRVQVLPGNAGSGVRGTTGCGRSGIIGASPLDGQNGSDGSNGKIDDDTANVPGGKGGDAGIACNNTNIVLGGLGGSTSNGSIGKNGSSALAGSLDGGAGAGGGRGGPQVNGSPGGASGAGATPMIPPSGCASTASGLGSTVLGGGGGLVNNPGTTGLDGIAGIDGAAGCQGTQGSQGSIQTCRFYVGGQGGMGTDGAAGSGGGGGGGGGGQYCTFCVDGTGNGGGGGGGGGAAGLAGEGSYGGGASFGIFICNNGINGYIEDCFIQAGNAGAGGLGGNGGTGGVGGSGGLGATVGLNEIGKGGDGGKGGNGGNGGDGGNGADGIAVNVYWTGTGIAPFTLDSTFDLAAQSVIQVNDVNTVGTTVVFTDLLLPNPSTASTNWNFDLFANNANPATATNNPSSATYQAAGRYNIIHNTIGFATAEYKGFFAIPEAFPIAFTTTNASSVAISDGSATAQGQGLGTYTYRWDNNASNQTTATATGLAVGNYCVTLTNSAGCEHAQCVDVLLNTAIYTINNSNNNLKLFPNPAQQNVQLVCSEIFGEKTIQIFDALGQLVYHQITTENQVQLLVQDFANGVYLLRLRTADTAWISEKLVVRK